MVVTAAKGSPILVVDDDEGLAALCEVLLEDAGYPVVTVNSGLEAVQQVSERELAVILLDIRMPGMDGIETFREIRRRAPQSRIVFMTGYAEPPVRHSRWRCGSIENLPEPDDLEHLIDSVIKIAEDRGALLLAQDLVWSRKISAALKSRTIDSRVVHDAHEAILHFEGRARQVVILEEKLEDLPPLIIRDLNPGVVRLLLSHTTSPPQGISLPPIPFLAKPFRPDELLLAIEMAVAES